MKSPAGILVIHTAFIGDVILVLPLLQGLRELFPAARIGLVSVPASAGVLANHPAVDRIHLYAKRGADRGLRGFLRLAREIRSEHYALALVPHRSLRSAGLAWWARIPRRVGFDTSAGRMLFSEVVPYRKEHHEIQRNLSLLSPLGLAPPAAQLPRVHPSEEDHRRVTALLQDHGKVGAPGGRMIALAPGSVWLTKRWPREHFEELARKLISEGWTVLLVGGEADKDLCTVITQNVPSDRLISAAGHLSLLQSAALLERCDVVVSNDSAPMHLATAVGTPVIGIFGATTPSFGFAPIGPSDRTLGLDSLSCRPCAIHGGPRCPIGTFECMWGITPTQVYHSIQEILHGTPRNS